MLLQPLKSRNQLDEASKVGQAYVQLGRLLDELSGKEIPESVLHSLNEAIGKVNAVPTEESKRLAKTIRHQQIRILKLIEKELKLVPKGYYRQVWLAVGMAAFGLPLGAAYGLLFGNMAFMGAGLPIGLAIGIAVGTAMDKKAQKEGRQLEWEPHK